MSNSLHENVCNIVNEYKETGGFEDLPQVAAQTNLKQNIITLCQSQKTNYYAQMPPDQCLVSRIHYNIILYASDNTIMSNPKNLTVWLHLLMDMIWFTFRLAGITTLPSPISPTYRATNLSMGWLLTDM